MQRRWEIFWEAFADGFSGAGLFGKLRRPGAPEFIVPEKVCEHKVDFMELKALWGCLDWYEKTQFREILRGEDQ